MPALRGIPKKKKVETNEGEDTTAKNGGFRPHFAAKYGVEAKSNLKTAENRFFPKTRTDKQIIQLLI